MQTRAHFPTTSLTFESPCVVLLSSCALATHSSSSLRRVLWSTRCGNSSLFLLRLLSFLSSFSIQTRRKKDTTFAWTISKSNYQVGGIVSTVRGCLSSLHRFFRWFLPIANRRNKPSSRRYQRPKNHRMQARLIWRCVLSGLSYERLSPWFSLSHTAIPCWNSRWSLYQRKYRGVRSEH